MMETVRIRRARVRYCEPAATGHRLDGLFANALGPALREALERQGVGADGELCLRAVWVPLPVRLGLTDAAVTDAWCDAIAKAIARNANNGGEGVLRFATTHDALLDLARGVADGDLSHAWAWSQLGMWHGSGGPTRELVGGLVGRPRAIVGVLATLAREHRLAPVAAHLDTAAWRSLADAALSAVGAPRGLSAGTASATAARTGDERAPSALGGTAGWRVESILRGSALADAMSGTELVAEPATLAVAALATLEAEPALPATAPELAARVITGVAERLHPIAPSTGTAERTRRAGRDAGEPSAADGDSRERPRVRDSGLVERSPVGSAEPVPRANREPADRANVRPSDPARRATDPDHGTHATDPSDPDGDADRRTDRTDPFARAHEHVTNADTDQPAQGDHPAPAADGNAVESPEPVAPRAGPESEAGPEALAATEWGGLLFLLHVAGELDLPAELARDPGGRSLRWWLHRLALVLAPTAEADPAALAFAGLGPDAVPPSVGEPPAADAERAVVAALGRRCADRLGERLADAAPDRLAQVCRRRAAVTADPSWIDVRMAADDVDTDVRRAGLDLDPGWLPWLGAVVRFVYV
jgi:hypothetical protein